MTVRRHEPSCAYYGMEFKPGSANKICSCPGTEVSDMTVDEESTSIWMITREFEYEGGGGRSHFEPMADVDLGYFRTREAAEAKLAELQQGEREDYKRRFERGPLRAYAERVDEAERIEAQNKVLEAAGLPLLKQRWIGNHPAQSPWTPGMSKYGVVEIEEAP
jgi:hypothetical protein